MNGLLAILIKEFAHIRREPMTLLFALVVPVLQLTIFGYGINMSIEDIATVVHDLDGRQESRAFLDALENTNTLHIVERVADAAAFDAAIASGRAKVGVRIPPDFSDRLLRGQQATVQVLIDGSNSNVATSALNAVNLLGLNQSLRRAKLYAESIQKAAARDPQGRLALPIEVRARLLYNPELDSAHFFVPALVGIILQNVTLFLTSFAIVRERELGTLEQLFVTPVGRGALLLGKLIPYALLGFIETLVVLLVMVFAFSVPIHGDLVLLILLSVLFLVTALGMGLLVSTVARSQLEAVQVSFILLLPSILLSGFVFPRETMPTPIYILSYLIPVSYFLEILRGVILRAATLRDLMPHVLGMSACCVAILALSVVRFRKQLD
ncbi:Inner membrane transport permease YbhS [Phycisphaerae bacterium RAS1]|nr:Inner membrane transport permease YbhS [Phycisphaerae bacterium RAS1]